MKRQRDFTDEFCHEEPIPFFFKFFQNMEEDGIPPNSLTTIDTEAGQRHWGKKLQPRRTLIFLKLLAITSI